MYEERYLAVIIAAGGMGTRFGGGQSEGAPKQFLKINGKSMIMTAADPFLRCGYTDEVIFVTPAEYVKQTFELIVSELGGVWAPAPGNTLKLRVPADGKDILMRVACGGQDRAASVRAGLTVANEDAPEGGLALIHDAARPFVSGGLILRVLEAAYKHGAAVPVTPIRDTVYIADAGGSLVGVPDRDRLCGVQTPQGFDLALITGAHERALAEGLSVTDDGAPVFANGGYVALVEGDTDNIKITTQEDLPEGGRTLTGDGFRIGIGFDAHGFEEGRKLVLGGVDIPFDKGLKGHSDADVLTHALMDAILGALREGDIGKIFPDTDPVYRGVSSMMLLAGVAGLMNRRGYGVVNADLTLVAERPRMAPYREDIERRLAEALGTAPENISLKATTTEKLGFTGREEGIAAEAVILLKANGS